MITLGTLANATAQQVFDQVALHMLTQQAKALTLDKYGEPACAYRGERGTMCAAGCLISDEEMERLYDWCGHNYNTGAGWRTLINIGFAPEEHRGLISALQDVHDNGSIQNWPDDLKKVAKARGLNTNVILQAGLQQELVYV